MLTQTQGGEVISPFEIEEAVLTVAGDRVSVCHSFLIVRA